MRRNEEEIRQKAKILFAAWRDDWNKFISDVFGVTLDKEQQEIVTAVQYNKLVSVRSGTARGKDFVAACIGTSFLYLTVNSPNGQTGKKHHDTGSRPTLQQSKETRL